MSAPPFTITDEILRLVFMNNIAKQQHQTNKHFVPIESVTDCRLLKKRGNIQPRTYDKDRAVMAAYGFKSGQTTESECVAELFKMYQTLTK